MTSLNNISQISCTKLIFDRNVHVRTNELFLFIMLKYIKTNVDKSVLIQSDFPTKLTINLNSLNMVHFCGNSNVSPGISKYLSRYEQMSITFQIFHFLTKTTMYLSCM